MIDARRVIAVQKRVVRLWHEREDRIKTWEDACRAIRLAASSGRRRRHARARNAGRLQWAEEAARPGQQRRARAGPGQGSESLTELAAEIALINAYQWHEEDKARATDVKAAGIAQVKRNIDQSNQRRVNAIERLDLRLEKEAAGLGVMRARLPLNSETPASIVDRVSILILKLHHMADQGRRPGLAADQRRRFFERQAVLKEQLKDLAGCLDELMRDILRGKRRFKTYFQLKMYNDPETNPYIKSRR